MGGKAVSQWHGRHIRSECRWSFDRYASRQRGADEPSPKSYLLEATYPLRKISALSGSFSPGSQSQSWVQTWVQLNPVWLCERNTNSTNFYWWQEQKFYNLLTLCILCINKTSTSSYFEVCGPANDRFHLPFWLWSVVPTWILSKKDAEPHPRIKNKGQTKSGKSAVGWDPLTISNIINRLKPTRAITSILKLGNYGMHCSLRTTILISIITQ